MGLSKFISKTGYKDDSPDRNNPYNIIPSSSITMKGVSQPIYGIDNLGNEQLMMPGKEYEFPGDYVIETPTMQNGGQPGNGWIMLDGVKSKKEYRGLDKNGNRTYVVLDEKGNELTWGIEKVGEEVVNIPNFPVADPSRMGLIDWGRDEKYLAKVEPKELTVPEYEPTIDTTPRKGVPKLPDPTIVGYTQRWDPKTKKYIQEPQYQVIAEADANRYREQGGEYQDMELSNEEIAAYRAQGYIVDEL